MVSTQTSLKSIYHHHESLKDYTNLFVYNVRKYEEQYAAYICEKVLNGEGSEFLSCRQGPISLTDDRVNDWH